MYRAPRLHRHLPRFPSPASRTLFTRSRAPPRSSFVTALYVTGTALGTGLFAVYYFDARSAVHRYLITPSIRYLFDPETGQKIALQVLRSGLGPRDIVPDDESLQFQLWGQTLSNPIGIAAGFDKNGDAVDGLFNLGFSWVEIGSVTPKPQDGNEKPRVFHLPEDDALINRYGFPSLGHAHVLSRLEARLPKSSPSLSEYASQKKHSFLAVNLGKNKQSTADSVDDYVSGVRLFGPLSDVLVVNVSSPNTPGLRDLQGRKQLDQLLFSVMRARDHLSGSHRPKIVLKVAPDLTENQISDIASVIRSRKIDGIIVSNTTVQRPESLSNSNKTEIGGLSGPPLKSLSLAAVRAFRSHLPASIPLIGAGGIATAADALEFAEAGASMVQIYTSFGYGGPGAPRRLKDDLVLLLSQKGTTWDAVSRQAVDQLSWRSGDIAQDSVQGLISEAEHIAGLLDELDVKLTQ